MGDRAVAVSARAMARHAIVVVKLLAVSDIFRGRLERVMRLDSRLLEVLRRRTGICRQRALRHYARRNLKRLNRRATEHVDAPGERPGLAGSCNDEGRHRG